MADVDLTNCDREPIHVPESVQAHGLLLVIDRQTQTVRRVGGAAALIGGGDLVGRTLSHLLGAEIAAGVAAAESAPEPIFIATAPVSGRAAGVDITAHAVGDAVVVELEPRLAPARSATETLSDISVVAGDFAAAATMQDVLEAAALHMRRITGFDRVMIYRFLEDESGAVVAEAKEEALAPFLHHHYPASDIPRQARALYLRNRIRDLRNRIRAIVDVAYSPAPLQPHGGEPLDMGNCALRSVSPVHLQYLKNMGVGASMSVSIIVNGELWGLIACHHGEARAVPYEQREVCKHVGLLLSQHIAARSAARQRREELALDAKREEWLAKLAAYPSLEAALEEHGEALLTLIPAQGAAIVGPAVRRFGQTPKADAIAKLAGGLGDLRFTPFATDSLVEHDADAAAFADTASGVIAAAVSGEPPLTLLWFRPERIQTLKWAGDPDKPVIQSGSAKMLTPRKSFETWEETVRNRAAPWSTAEIDAARRGAAGLSELRASNTLRTLNSSLRSALAEREDLLAQKDLLMREINHRVQNSLQLVMAMLSTQGRHAEEESVKAHLQDAARRILAVSAVHRRLWKGDQISDVDFGAYLSELRDDLVQAWGAEWDGHVTVEADRVLVPTDKAVVLSLVITEILTNAVKYAYEGRTGAVDLRVNEAPGRGFRIVVADRGVGIRTAPKKGLGSHLIQTLTRQLQGEVSTDSGPRGTTVTLTIPTARDGS